LRIATSDEPEKEGIEFSPNIMAELNEKGKLIGIEILSASTFIRYSILEAVPAKTLKFSNFQSA